MELTRVFEKLGKNDVGLAGGKGASLGEMTQAGISVPPGFVILADSFEKFIEETQLLAEIDAELDKVNHSDINSVEEASEKIKAVILSRDMPKDIEKEIISEFNKLGAKFVAVRSSATSEDSASAAWAGQLESYLNTTSQTLLENVKKCWASLFTPRAIFYRFEKGLQKEKVSVAVVVQKMVESEKSGIAFSVHPVTQDYNQIIIEAGFGLGEAIVSGQITPDSYVITKDKLDIIENNISEQTRGIYRTSDKGGNVWRDMGEKGKEQVLADKEIIELSELIIKIENHYKFPVDVEWAYEKGKFYIVQSRPITTLEKKEEERGNENQNEKKINEIISPIKEAGNWNYYVTRKFNWIVEKTQIIATQTDIQKRLLSICHPKKYLILNGDEYENSDNCNEYFKVLNENFDKDNNFFSKFSKKELEIVSSVNEYRIKLKKMNLSNISNIELASKLKVFFNYYSESFVPAWMRPDTYLEMKIKYLLNKELKNEEETNKIFNSIASYPDIIGYKLDYNEEPLSLLKLAKKINSIYNISKKLDKKIKKHVEKYSWMKGPVSFDELEFTRKDYLERIDFLLKENIDSRIRSIIKTREENEKQFKKISVKFKSSIKLLKLFQALRQFIFLRTYTTEASDHLFFIGRKTLFKEAALRLNLTVSDIVMLSPEEIINSLVNISSIDNPLNKITSKGGFSIYPTSTECDTIKGIEHIKDNLKKTIEERKQGFAIIIDYKNIFTIFGKKALDIQKSISNIYKKQDNLNESDNRTIRGVSAMPGKTRGIVKVLLKPEDSSKLNKGDILVSSMTTPDFISAMEKASAFVTDEGGVTCHAAIMAREFSVPCIIGTKFATSVLHDGDFVEVDANEGVVRILERGK